MPVGGTTGKASSFIPEKVKDKLLKNVSDEFEWNREMNFFH